MSRADKIASLRSALSRYIDGRLETGSSGGAGGMVFFVNAAGQQFYIGGFNVSDAESIVRALNLTLEQGLCDVHELRRMLRAEGLIATRRNASADRRIRDALRGVAADSKEPAEQARVDGRYVGLILYPPDPQSVDREGDGQRRRLLAEMHLASGQFWMAWLYLNYPGDAAAFGEETVTKVRASLRDRSVAEGQRLAVCEHAEHLLTDYLERKAANGQQTHDQQG